MVDLEVDVCRLLIHASGKKELGPVKAKEPPEVERAVDLSPAKSASTKSLSSRSSGLSWIVPTNLSIVGLKLYTGLVLELSYRHL